METRQPAARSGLDLKAYAAVLGKTLLLIWRMVPALTALHIFLMTIQGVLPTVNSWLIGCLVDSVLVTSTARIGGVPVPVLGVGAAWLGISLLGSVIAQVSALVKTNTSELFKAKVNISVMEKACALPDLAYYEDPRFYDALQIIQRESAIRPVMTLDQLCGIFQSTITIVSAWLLLAGIHPFIPVIIATATIPQAIASLSLQKRVFDEITWKTPETRMLNYYSSVLLADTHAKEVRVLGIGKFFVERYRTIAALLYRTTSHIRTVQAAWGLLLGALTVVGMAVALWLVLPRVISGQVSVGLMTTLIFATLQLQSSLTGLVAASTGTLESILYMRSYFSFLDRRSTLLASSAGQQRSFQDVRKAIEFRHVSFTYPNARRALHDISFSIARGETVALVGENGSGKTTIIKLLARLYDPEAGEILVDGVPLTDYNLPSWQQQLSVVFQDFGRYFLTIRENIALGRLEASGDSEKIAQAATMAGLSETINRLPDSLDTKLGKVFDGGYDLSGGEWQKLAIARAFFRRTAQVMVLDEPTASLDARAEHELFEHFAELCRGKTTILVSHRLGSVRKADRIIVLDQGRVIEEGTHDHLMAQNGQYAGMYRLQAERYSADNSNPSADLSAVR